MTLHPPSLATDLERALAASILRKQRSMERERAATAADSNALWIAQGGTATVHGYAIGDFVYLGNHLPQFDGYGIEPSLIRPELPVDPAHANHSGEGMTYWPSYSSISPASRTAFLQWLAGGRSDPQAYIGYVFIFFYGLERRVYEFIHQRGSSADEVLAIAREVARLLRLHGARSQSFASYGDALLDLVAAIEPRARAIARTTPVTAAYGIPQRVAIALGELSLEEKPIPASLALDWVRATQPLATPAKRCPREFELLFHIRYASQFGDGLVVKPPKARLDLTYRPASAALPDLNLKQRSIPNVVSLTRPLTKLFALAQECCSALDPFSRFLGKNRGGRESLAAFAVLPEELIEGTHSADAAALAELVRSRLDGGGRAVLGAGELLHYVRVARPDRIAKAEAVLLAQSLEKLGYGIEPDIRLGGPAPEFDGRVIVFRRLPDCPSTASDDYATAALCMRLGATVSAADDDVSDDERALLERHIAETLQLSPGERQRLGAHLAWLVETKPGTGGLRKRLAALGRDARQHIGAFLVDIATTDGRVDPREMKILEKLYDLLSLDTSQLYRDIHAAHAGDDEPVTVAAPPSAPRGFSIPPQPAATTASGLDMSRVRLRIAETREVATLLGSIFVDETVTVAATPVAAQAGTIGTLDAAHSELLRRLAQQESWPRDDVERLAAELALLTDGALETINDYAYASADEPFWEDGDPLAINTTVAMELMR